MHKHRRERADTSRVLESLQPDSGRDIRGHMKSSAELCAESGYVDRPGDFVELLKILDSELRLITASDPEGDVHSESSHAASLDTRFYQLTHDYLVPSLRDWLTRKQRETRRGRAELRLAERAA